MRKWKGLRKVVEEMGELIQEMMKLMEYPAGKHPRRKRSLVISTQEEAADVLASVNYFIDRNGLDRPKIERRAAYKYRKWVKRYGETPAMAKKKRLKQATKQSAKRVVTKAAKKSSKVQSPSANASSHVETSQTTS